MSKRDKLIERFLTIPKDFSWAELSKILNGYGYKEVSGGKTGDSRIRFVHLSLPPIILHKPHPKPILKCYQIEMIINLLKREKLV